MAQDSTLSPPIERSFACGAHMKPVALKWGALSTNTPGLELSQEAAVSEDD